MSSCYQASHDVHPSVMKRQLTYDLLSNNHQNLTHTKVSTKSRMGCILEPAAPTLLSSFKDKYSGSWENQSIPNDVLLDETASAWIWWWLRYFQQNHDYKAYCEARRSGDSAASYSLENRFSRISELYTDWGDIHILKMGRERNEWKAWLYEHRHLFNVIVPSIRQIELPITGIESGNIAIQIPEGLQKKKALRLFEAFIECQYPDSKTIGESKSEKYSLYAPKGRIDQSTFNSVKKAYYSQFLAQHPERLGLQQRSHAETALEIMSLDFKANLGFNDTWQLDPDQEQRLRTGTLSMLELESFKKQIGRFHKTYVAYVANTIHGVFPKSDITTESAGGDR
jgi:hypothetical protein